MVHLARDGAFAGLQPHLRDLRDRNQGAARRREHQVSDRLGTAARRRRKTDGRVVSPFTDEHLAHRVATDSGLDQVRDVRDVDAVTGGGRAIDFDGDLRQRRLLVDRYIGRAGRGFENANDLFSDPAQLVEVVAEYLDDELAVRAGDLVVDAVDHGLAEPDIESGHRVEFRGHTRDQLLLGFAGRPGAVGVKADAGFDMRRRPRISAVVVSPELGDDVGYFGEFADRLAQIG